MLISCRKYKRATGGTCHPQKPASSLKTVYYLPVIGRKRIMTWKRSE